MKKFFLIGVAISILIPLFLAGVVLIISYAYPPFKFTEEGIASWYGPGFAGHPTANGEIYNPEDFTAAHRTLPLGSLISVTKVKSGVSVVVRITDRGPYVGHRIIDLSRAAASAIGITEDMGIAKVRLDGLLKP